MNATHFEAFKAALLQSERLFVKLHRVGKQYEDLEYDESGFHAEEEQVILGRWAKLSQKLREELAEHTQGFEIALGTKRHPSEYTLALVLKDEEGAQEVVLDYAKEGELSLHKKEL